MGNRRDASVRPAPHSHDDEPADLTRWECVVMGALIVILYMVAPAVELAAWVRRKMVRRR